jgi:cytochrome oxidase Cu insertion factor (SCO1/SenC/PrrC family)
VSKPPRFAIIALSLCFLVLAGGALVARLSALDPVRPTMPGTRIGGPFSLVDQDGRTVTNESWPGQYRLVYFGFTYCPAICPTELQKMATALKALGPEGAKIQPLFVSVDPERDTSAVLKPYVALFHDRLVGLTGSRAQIDAMLKSWHVYAAKIHPPGATEYTMDHSSFTYLTDPDGMLLALYKNTDTAQAMAEDIRGILTGR